MSKPVEVIHPITGQRCFTKHPERLIARCRAAKSNTDSDKNIITICKGIAVVDRWTFPHTQWLTAEVEA